MNGNNILVDTNIASYLLGGDSSLAELLENKNVYVSFITELELLGFKDISELEKLVIEDFLKDCIIYRFKRNYKTCNDQFKAEQKSKVT